MKRHSQWGGSNAYIWTECPGSVYLSKLAPKREAGEAAARGNLMHDVAADLLTSTVNASDATRDLTPEEAATVAMYVADVMHIEHDTRYVETEFVHPTEPNIFGTIDFAVVKDTTCYLVDLKTGRHEVSAADNKQLLFYAWLLWLRHPSHIVDFELGIWQGGNFDWWSCTAHDIQAAGEVFMSAYRSNTIVVGNHCGYCQASGICAERRRTLGIVRQIGEAATLSHQQIADSLPLCDKLDEVTANIRAMALHLAHKGALPGYKITAGRKKPLKWKTQDIDPTAIGVPAADLFETSMKTATQVAKLCTEEKLIALGYAERPEPNPVLTPIHKSDALVALTDW